MRTYVSGNVTLDSGRGSSLSTGFSLTIDHRDDFEFNTKLQEAIMKQHPDYVRIIRLDIHNRRPG